MSLVYVPCHGSIDKVMNDMRIALKFQMNNVHFGCVCETVRVGPHFQASVGTSTSPWSFRKASADIKRD